MTGLWAYSNKILHFGFNEADIQADDGSLWGDSEEESNRTSDLDREWQRRHDQFHTIGCRDGLIAGKEASAQEGFNIGFKQSVPIGYNWGITRGFTSAPACLPDELREKLIETQEQRDKFQELHVSVNSLSASDALKLFHDDILTKKAAEQRTSKEDGVQEQSFNEADIQVDDRSLWGDSEKESNRTSDLDREWQRRHDQFHTIACRDGLIAGKEASAQEGFNIGFKQSVPIGYNWGITRGVTSALACLLDELREKLIETQEQRVKFQELHVSVNSFSASDTLKLFHDDILIKKATEQSISKVDGPQKQSSNSATLGTYTTKLQSLILDTPEIQVQLFVVN
ncbi:hypothetical protein V6N13_076184 [Hibiscus sabdariffa]|uniref:Essential protein Yae1 N-terminal domain-containing protein n=1 Tax=Hibiscus sabdariffa TaxID=183260 RepID=A0ABR2CT57_9ROSI